MKPGSDRRRGGGPKTPAGRARVAQNARKHGLATPVHADPSLAPHVEALARKLAESAGHSEHLAAAYAIAAAHYDLRRIDLAKREALSRPQVLPWPSTRDLIYAARRLEIRKGINARVIATALRARDRIRDPSLHEAMAIRSAELFRLERYERRAFSRLVVAVRSFTAKMTKSGRTNSLKAS